MWRVRSEPLQNFSFEQELGKEFEFVVIVWIEDGYCREKPRSLTESAVDVAVNLEVRAGAFTNPGLYF